jgi:Synergist-CTERM protein sorting domain-containing protein
VRVTDADGRSAVAPTPFTYVDANVPAALGGGGCNGTGSVPTLLALLPLLAFWRRRPARR